MRTNTRGSTGSNPLIYNDPSGHEALPKSVEEIIREFKVIKGGLQEGAKSGSKRVGPAGFIVGLVIGGLFGNPTPVGESQEDINKMKAENLGLTLINSANLENLNKDNNRILVYRALNAEDVKTIASGQGIVAKDVTGYWNPEEHILFGSDEDAWINDPWISTTADPAVAFGTFHGYERGVVVVDLSKINTNKIYFPTFSLKSGTRAHDLAVKDKKILIKYSIPQNAILGVMY